MTSIITATTFTRILKTLRESSSTKEKCEALTYISSQARKLESAGVIKEEQYKELCRLVIEIFTKEGREIQYEAIEALDAILQEFRAHSLHVFESLLQTNKKTRLKILKLLEIVHDDAISAATNDGTILNFFEDCMRSVETSSMKWIAPTTCIDNLQMLTDIEHQILSNEQKLDEDTVNCVLALLARLYKLTAVIPCQNVQMFDALLMNKVITLAYMGHKRQRGSALKVLQQVVTTNSALRIYKDCPDMWVQFKSTLQSTYCKRMSVLVGGCEPDWSIQWNIAIQFLGTDLHRGATLINNLLSVEEKAFKSGDIIIRRQAFLSWKFLIDNFALDNQELATVRRIKLLCIPLNTKNSKNELISVTKLEVWWHLIIKLYKDIAKFVTPVITQFLNFCFGPLGDTPLLSSKFDVVASPGKRFLKTKIFALDALYQLLVIKEENLANFSPLLEESLPHAISHDVFQECSKSVIHSIGEALLILSQLTDQELKNRYQLGKALWTSLMKYIKDSKLQIKDHLYKDVILMVTELVNHIDKSMIKDMTLNVILPDVSYIIMNSEFNDYALPELVLKLLSFPILGEMSQQNYLAIKCLLQRCISPEITYSTGVLGFLGTIMKNLKLLNDTHKNIVVSIELWQIIAEILTKYITDSNKIDDGSGNGHNFKTIKSVLSFPFRYTFSERFEQIENSAMIWQNLYKQFELQSDLISTVKSNEILLDTADMMRNSLNINKNCCSFIAHCLTVLLSTINYESLLAQDEIPSVMLLTMDVITISLNNSQNLDCERALKVLSAILISAYGVNSQKVTSYLIICEPVIELMLASQIKELLKEIINTWETIISIFKGLNKLLNHELLLSYERAITKATQHSNSCIRSLAWSIFEVKNDFNNISKQILNEIEKCLEKRTFNPKSGSIMKKKEETEKEICIPNKKSANSKLVPNKPNDKKKSIMPEPDSQGYVYIKTDLKFDVNRLTEHQKETLKKKREDIPALYNDLSQSSSQNSQNLQEWFDIKAKHINELDKPNNKKNSAVTEKPIDNDANKENKDTVMRPELIIIDKAVNSNNGSKSDGDTEENIDTNRDENSNKESNRENFNEKNENNDTSKQSNLDIHLTSSSKQNVAIGMNDEADTGKPISVAKKLNFESREEFPENKTPKQQSSPSTMENKRRHDNITKSNSSLRSDDTVENQQISSTTNNVQKTLRRKVVLEKSCTDSKQKIDDDNNVGKNCIENKKDIKHKYVPELESEAVPRRKRKLNMFSTTSNDEDSDNSRDIINPISIGKISRPNIKILNQRMRKEISRLKIDMVFDSPTVNRRRSKHADENDKETVLKKNAVSDNKNLRLRGMYTKHIEGLKRSPHQIEKDIKDINDQSAFKRRSRRNIRSEFEKDNSDIIWEIKKTNDNTKEVPELKISMDADTSEPEIILISEQTVQNIHEVQNKEPDKDDDSTCNTNKNMESLENTKTDIQNQNEVEDVVESSQTSNIGLKSDKKCNDKRCFIKINKIAVNAVKPTDEEDYVPESSTVDHDDNNIADLCENSDKVTSNDHTFASDEDKNDTNKNSIQEINNFNTNTTVLVGQKTVDNLSSLKIAKVSSPKIFSKTKSFIPHGRAAHMLGLVTKQSQIEDDNTTIVFENESLPKKLKTKDINNEMVTSNKKSMLKELDKIGGPSGSRQEKIFNNMRSTERDYSISPSTKMFSNLKNDGEKLLCKKSKNTLDCSTMEDTVNKENNGNMSPLREKGDLPILEWSSANPPSLSASPSASILKRHRTLELDPDWITPSKRKRVSFADPPVSKEMGYEISNIGSPHRTNKCSTIHSPITKKDSPLKFKQMKPTLMPINLEKMTTDNETEIGNEIDFISQEDKENELLKETDEQDSSTMDVNIEKSYDPTIRNNIIEINFDVHCTDDDIAQQIEITQDSSILNQQILSSKVSQSPVKITCMDYIRTENSGTQQDIFDGMDTKSDTDSISTNNNNNVNTSIQDNSVHSAKQTNDSVIVALSAKEASCTSLEDTVDVQNITELNSTVNSDEIFCGKLIRTSTHTTENLEQDTLLATDSIFASLPSTQDTQDSQKNVELDPQFLDSTQSIYPALSSCQESINKLIEQLTYPLWKRSLSSYFANKNLHTIGDFVQLTEREINRMPLKGKSKIDFVKKVLQHFESTWIPQTKSSDNLTEDQIIGSNVIAKNERATIPTATIICDNVEMTSTTIDNEDISCSTSFNQSNEMVSGDLPTEKSVTDKTESIINEICPTDISSEAAHFANPDLSVSQLNNAMCIKTKVLTTAQSLLETSTDHDKYIVTGSTLTSSTIETAESTDEVASCSTTSMDTSELPASTSNLRDEAFITHSSIGVNTDCMSPSKSTVKVTTKSVASQMALEELLDEIDVNLVLESAARRCSPAALLSQFKMKLGHLSKTELVKETIKMLGPQNKQQVNDATLRVACRSSGVDKVLLRLPDIFSSDKEFFDKVLKVYNKKLKITDCLNTFDSAEVKNAICQKYTSSELVDMLSNKLKREEQEGIKQPMPEVSSLNAMLRRLPMDVIISHTVANEELIPASLVLDIALQNNSSKDIERALETHSPDVIKHVLDKLWTSQFTISQIENKDISKENLFNILKSLNSKLSAQELLCTFNEAMESKLVMKQGKE